MGRLICGFLTITALSSALLALGFMYGRLHLEDKVKQAYGLGQYHMMNMALRDFNKG